MGVVALARKPFVVIDAEILSSSVWSEAAHVRLVWLTMLILCDTEGYVGAAIPGIARAAGVTLDQTREALSVLMRPDPDSRTQSNEGRRLEPAERGFRILNFREHLDRLSAEKAKTRDRVRKFRERKRHETRVTESPVTVPVGKREQGIGTSEHNGRTDWPRLPANPLIEGRRPTLEKEAYRLIREVSALEPDRDPTEILMEAAGWKNREGQTRTKVRIETMTDDHLIRTVHDLRTILEDATRKHGTAAPSVQREP